MDWLETWHQDKGYKCIYGQIEKEKEVFFLCQEANIKTQLCTSSTAAQCPPTLLSTLWTTLTSLQLTSYNPTLTTQPQIWPICLLFLNVRFSHFLLSRIPGDTSEGLS